MNLENLVKQIRTIGYNDTQLVCVENNILLLDIFPRKNEKVLWKSFPKKNGPAKIIVINGRFVFFDLEEFSSEIQAFEFFFEMVINESIWI